MSITFVRLFKQNRNLSTVLAKSPNKKPLKSVRWKVAVKCWQPWRGQHSRFSQPLCERAVLPKQSQCIETWDVTKVSAALVCTYLHTFTKHRIQIIMTARSNDILKSPPIKSTHFKDGNTERSPQAEYLHENLHLHSALLLHYCNLDYPNLKFKNFYFQTSQSTTFIGSNIIFLIWFRLILYSRDTFVNMRYQPHTLKMQTGIVQLT